MQERTERISLLLCVGVDGLVGAGYRRREKFGCASKLTLSVSWRRSLNQERGAQLGKRTCILPHESQHHHRIL